MSDLLHQNLATVQSNRQPTPPNIGAAVAAIAPVHFLTQTTAGVAITTITPPVSGTHMIGILFADVAGVAGGGNIAAVKASSANHVMLLVYNPVTALYYPVS